MVPAAKEILFSIGILFIPFFYSKWGFSKRSIISVRFSDFVKFKDRENEFVFSDTWEPRLFVKLYASSS